MSWWNQWFVICHMFVCSVHSLAPEHCGATPGSGLLWVLLHPSTANGWSSFWSRHPPQLSGQWGEKEFINKPNQSVSSGGFILFFKALLSLEVAVIYKAVLNWCRSTVIISPLLVRYLFAHYFFLAFVQSNMFQTAIYNQTVTITEKEEGLDGET